MLSYAFCLLLLGAFANCDTAVPPVPNYLQSQLDINDVIDTLAEQIKTMEGQIPLLNDSRRQYAEIVHVIYHLGDSQSGCFRPDYNTEYLSNINKYVPEALSNPQVVIDEVRKQTDEFTKSTYEIRAVIREECLPSGYGSLGSLHLCDVKVQKRVDSTAFLKLQARILLAAGKAASAFLANREEFLAASKAHSAEAYIIQGVGKFKDVVFNFADYLRESRKKQYGASSC